MLSGLKIKPLSSVLVRIKEGGGGFFQQIGLGTKELILYDLIEHYLCSSDGTLNGARAKDINTLRTQKTVSLEGS